MTMKRYYSFYLPIVLVTAIGSMVSVTIPETVNARMMDGGNMKGMMQRMMGDILPPGIEPALLPASGTKGAKLLGHYCTQCHNLPGPGMHTAREWPAVIDRMSRRMQMMSGHGMMMGNIEAPSENELQALVAYLQEYAQKPIDMVQYPDLDTAAGRAFRKTCAQCHALPDPGQHTGAEWPPVLERMKHNMVVMHKTLPDEQAMKEIAAFLQRHAKARD